MSSCHGLILAGGLSTRMGTDKAKLCRNQQTMLGYTESLLHSLGLNVLVSGGDKGIPDVVPMSGPLGGIYTVIKGNPVDALLIVPVDMPLLTSSLLQQLISVGESSGTAVCYQDCYLPLYLPVNTELSDYLAQVFSEGASLPRSIKKMLTAVNAIQIPVTEPMTLINANTPEEWLSIKPLIETDDAE
ncbi:MAG: NTP transferase domain-containing protein [Porticoccus sp.]